MTTVIAYLLAKKWRLQCPIQLSDKSSETGNDSTYSTLEQPKNVFSKRKPIRTHIVVEKDNTTKTGTYTSRRYYQFARLKKDQIIILSKNIALLPNLFINE